MSTTAGDATPRVQLARLAVASAASLPGIAGFTAGPGRRWVTAVEGEQLEGVVCMPEAGGGYSLDLHLIARLVPLDVLAEKVRKRVERDTARAGLGELLRRIDVAFEDIDDVVPPLPAELTR